MQAKSAANQRLTTNQTKAPPKKNTRAKAVCCFISLFSFPKPAKKGRPKKVLDKSGTPEEEENTPEALTTEPTAVEEESTNIELPSCQPEIKEEEKSVAQQEGTVGDNASIEDATYEMALEEAVSPHLAQASELQIPGASEGPEPMNVQEEVN